MCSFWSHKYHTDLCNESWSFVRPAGKNFNVGHYTHCVQPIFLSVCFGFFCLFVCSFVFIPAMPIGTIDFYHFIALSLPLTLPGGHKFNAKQNLWALFSRTLFI